MKPGDRFNPFNLFVGLFVPNGLARYRKISANAKLLYGRLTQFAGKNGECFPSQALLAQEIGLTERAIRKLIKELKDDRFIEIVTPGMMERFDRNTAVYTFLWHPIFDESLKTEKPIGTKVPMEPIGMSMGTNVPKSIGTKVPIEEIYNREENQRRESKGKGIESLFPPPIFYQCEFFEIEQGYYKELAKDYPLIDFQKLFKKLRDKIFDEPKRYKRDGRGKLKSLRTTVRNWCENAVIWGEKNNGKGTGSIDPVDKRFQSAFGDFRKDEAGTAQKNS